MNPRLVLIAHNLRSAHNVGSLLRTADGLGVQQVFLTGYTPYPWRPGDIRLPHLARKIDHQISKTALGAEKLSFWKQDSDIFNIINELRDKNYVIAALEQSPKSVILPDYLAPQMLALIVGREVEGLEPEILQASDAVLEIPMLGQKESFNVAVAAAISLYQLRYGNR